MISDQGILFIEPQKRGSKRPLIDDLTQKMTSAFMQAEVSEVTKGVHHCICGAVSENKTYTLPNGETTHSLCIHYLAMHRDEVPSIELEKVRALNCGESEPDSTQTAGRRYSTAGEHHIE